MVGMKIRGNGWRRIQGICVSGGKGFVLYKIRYMIKLQ
jgi:hypothetical protein